MQATTKSQQTIIEENVAAMVYDLTNRQSTTLIERQGSNLVIKLSNGEEAVIEGFFIAFSEQDFHEMQGGVYNATVGQQEVAFEAVIEPDSYDSTSSPSSNGDDDAIGIGLLAAGGAAVAASGGIGSKDDDDENSETSSIQTALARQTDQDDFVEMSETLAVNDAVTEEDIAEHTGAQNDDTAAQPTGEEFAALENFSFQDQMNLWGDTSNVDMT